MNRDTRYRMIDAGYMDHYILDFILATSLVRYQPTSGLVETWSVSNPVT